MGKKIKKVLITTGLVSMVILSTMITGCSKKEAVTTESTQVEAVFESEGDLNISTQQTSVSKELAEQASKEIEELTRLEAESQIQYNEVSGDIINPTQEKQNEDMMNVIRQEVIDGDIKGQEIDEEVDMWCDFLSDTEKAEFKSELHLLEQSDTKAEESQSHETHSQQTKPAETKSHNVSKPAQTKPAPQPQQTQAPAPVVETPTPEPAPQPEPTQQENNNTSGEIDTSGWSLGGGATIEHRPLDDDQGLSSEEYDDINNTNFN